MTVYTNFKTLADHEMEGRDYRVRIASRDGRVLIMAPHGGKIEPGTTEIADAIAGTDYSFYSFEGLKSSENGVLHIESHLFDEPQALAVVEKADMIITVHGQLEQNKEFVMLGGLNDGLRLEMQHQLEKTGFQTRPPSKGLTGTDPMNICNRGKLQGGVQLEISRKMRDVLRTNHDRLKIFAGAVREGIRLYLTR